MLGVALGSGGARGWCHIGVLRALEEIGATPSHVAGCSMGALVGAAYAAGQLDALETWARRLTPGAFLRLMDVRPGSGGIVAGRRIYELLGTIGLPPVFSDLQLPFACNATELETGREIWMRDGDLRPAVRASIAIPGMIGPYQVDGAWCVDGALTNPVPVTLARAMGAEVILAVNPNGIYGGRLARPQQEEPKPIARLLQGKARGKAKLWPEGILSSSDGPPAYADVVNGSLDVMTQLITRMRLAGDPPDVLLNARLTRMTVLEFTRAEEAIDEGHHLVMDQRDTILRFLDARASA